MGTTYHRGSSKADVKNSLRADFAPIAERSVGNEFYLLVADKDGHKSVYVCLLSSEKGFGWGYKDMSETSGPYYFNCPNALLDMADAPLNKYSTDWREACRKSNAVKKARKSLLKGLKPGDEVILKPGCAPSRLIVTEVGKMIRATADGRSYRLKKSYIASIA